MGKVTIIIPAVPPSGNVFAGRKNFQEYRDEKEKWTALVCYVGRVHRPPQPFDKARVTLLYRFKDRTRRDPDNYCGKLLLDGLTKAGIIVDDSFKHIQLVLDAEDEPGPDQTTIIVEEIKKDGRNISRRCAAGPDNRSGRAANEAQSQANRLYDPRKSKIR